MSADKDSSVFSRHVDAIDYVFSFMPIEMGAMLSGSLSAQYSYKTFSYSPFTVQAPKRLSMFG